MSVERTREEVTIWRIALVNKRAAAAASGRPGSRC